MKKLIVISLILFLIALTIYYFYPEKVLPQHIRITSIVVYKSKREMLVYSNNTLLKTYTVSLGKVPIGDKIFEGDYKTPEGRFIIDSKNANSTCYKNLGISYPDESHSQQAKQLDKQAGGDIKIHGLPNKEPYWGKLHRFKDWTNGCIAVTNKEMDELYESVAIGTPIVIKP
ncbi:MAG: hypothetical protein C0459_14145 [Chitinophaga sp.]|jgi:murein L,D-transpeptidase YafK|nr:hypothetical protein [Chitinophaga sp.]